MSINDGEKAIIISNMKSQIDEHIASLVYNWVDPYKAPELKAQLGQDTLHELAKVLSFSAIRLGITPRPKDHKPIILGQRLDGSDDYGDMLIYTCAVCQEPRHVQPPDLLKNCTISHDYEGHCHHYDPWNKG